MTEKRDPPRLIDDPELGAALRAFREESVSPERIAANGRALADELATLPRPGTAAIRPLTIAGGIVAVGAAVLVARFLATPDAPPAVPPTPTSTPAALAIASATPEAAAEVTATPDEIAASTPIATPAAKTPTPTPATTPPETPRPAPPAGGTLALELALFDGARTAASSGAYADALARLDELEERFPRTALRPEVELSRAEWLVAAGRHADAIPVLTALVTSPAHAGRRAELERTLGDARRLTGDCAAARSHYRAALAAGAAGEEASAARRGLGACAAE